MNQLVAGDHEVLAAGRHQDRAWQQRFPIAGFADLERRLAFEPAREPFGEAIGDVLNYGDRNRESLRQPRQQRRHRVWPTQRSADDDELGRHRWLRLELALLLAST